MIEIIEELDNLMCSAVRTDGGEADYVTEEDAGTVEYLRFRHLTFL